MAVGNHYNGPDETVLMDFALQENPSGCIDSVVDSVWGKVNLEGGRKTNIKKQLLKVLLLNLRSGLLVRKSVAYNASPAAYSSVPKRYREPIERYDLMMSVIDELKKNDFIEIKKGRSYKNPRYQGELSKCCATNKLQKLSKVVRIKSASKPPAEVVVLKDSKGNLVDYKDTSETKNMREEIDKINLLRSTAKLSLKHVPAELINDENKDLIQRFCEVDLDGMKADKKGRLPEIVLRNSFLWRVFNNNRFSLGGRFYGGIETQLPKELRKYLYINGRPTVELDFSAHHIRILYHQCGLTYTKDPYAFCKGLRGLYKFITMAVFNTTKKSSAIKAILQANRDGKLDLSFLGKDKYREVEKHFDKWEKEHALLKDYFFSLHGTRLMFVDSTIMSRILKHFTDKGVVALSVHDSVIVQKRYEGDLRKIMHDEYRSELGFDPVIK